MSAIKATPASTPAETLQQPTPGPSSQPSARSTPTPGPSTPQRAIPTTLQAAQTTPGSGITYRCSTGHHLRTFVPPPCACGCQEMHYVRVISIRTSQNLVDAHPHEEAASDESNQGDNEDRGLRTQLRWAWRCDERERLHLHEVECEGGCQVRSLWDLPKLPMR